MLCNHRLAAILRPFTATLEILVGKLPVKTAEYSSVVEQTPEFIDEIDES
jgi:hypothetical protein